MQIWLRVKFFFWWHFKACEHDKALHDQMVYGQSFFKNGKRIDPKEIYKSNQEVRG